MNRRVEKIGTVEMITVKSHARELYLPLDRDTCSAFGIHKGDLLKVKLIEKVTEGGEESGE